MSEILRVIATSPKDLQPVLDTVAENAARLCEANNATMVRIDGNTLQRLGSAKYGPMPARPHQPSVVAIRQAGRIISLFSHREHACHAPLTILWIPE